MGRKQNVGRVWRREAVIASACLRPLSGFAAFRHSYLTDGELSPTVGGPPV